MAIKGECETCEMYIANLKNDIIAPLEATIQHYDKFCEVYENNFGSIPDGYECNIIK